LYARPRIANWVLFWTDKAGADVRSRTTPEIAMNRRSVLNRSLITIGVLGLLGTGSAALYAVQTEPAGTGANSPQTTQQVPEATPGTPVPHDYGSWNPWLEMHRMQESIDGLFAESWDRMHAEMAGLEPATIAPSAGEVTLREEKNDYLVTANFPGVKEGDLNVSLDGRLLRISAQSQSQERDTADNGQVMHEEDYASSIQRAFTLPGPVDASKMHTQFGDGILTITIPKAVS
jgi:HSP20 family protein